MILDAIINWRYKVIWEREYENNYHRVITPEAPEVQKAVESIKPTGSKQAILVDIWDWVVENIDYRLTRSWIPPNKVIQKGIGDCEDVTFTILSMALASGIKDMKVVLGRLKHPNKQRPPENHVWLRYRNYIIDGTTSMDRIKDPSRYINMSSYDVKRKGNILEVET